MTYGDEMTEITTTDLEGLKEEAGEGLALAKDSFQITQVNKGKKVVIRTQNNFKTMVNKPPNADGAYEVSVELLGQAQDKPVAAPVEQEKK